MVFNSRTEKSKDHWETPESFFKLLDKEFHFTLDPCSSDKNHKCEKYFTKEQDGLSKDWMGEIVFCNPPYKNIATWVKKCFQESQKSKFIKSKQQWILTTVVMLIPCRTDTRYFHDYIMKADEIRFVKGRINFELNGRPQGSPNFASIVVVFKKRWEDRLNYTRISSFYHKESDRIKEECDISEWI